MKHNSLYDDKGTPKSLLIFAMSYQLYS